MSAITIVSFFLFMGLVAIISYFYTRKEKLDTEEGYYLAGKSLSAWVIAGTLILTNLSTEQLIGLSAEGYEFSISSMAFEVIAAIALIIVAIFFLPRYLKGNIVTVPDFLSDRYDEQTKQIVTFLFLFGYVLNLMPPVLYTGSLALNGIFDIENILGVDRFSALMILSIFIGAIGAVYAIFGGLKAVAISDTVNAIGLLIGGLLIPILGLSFLGDGSMLDGFATIVNETPEKLNAVGSSSEPVPFSTLFTGLVLIGLSYWGTNQLIIQRTIAAKSLKEGQKGVLIAAAFKLLTPIIIILPGIIAFNIFGDDLIPEDAYPELVAYVLPEPLLGFFAAVLAGAILSTFNSALNSSVTLFMLNVYKPYINPQASQKMMVQRGKIFGIVLAIIAIFIAPMIDLVSTSFFEYLMTINGLYNVPILTIFIIGYLTKKVPAVAAKIGLAFFIVTYAITQFWWNTGISYIHTLGILFVLTTGLMLLIGKIRPRDKAYVLKVNNTVDITNWKYLYPVSLGIIIALVVIYIIFSKIGIAQQ
ncbi:solute:sodium symporter family transporter [Lentibacillus salicampi]|uniref:Solute:sodium symporter family transporter n=1 Tax=Lentibacillus salicampi TaxID=175306 RepID=A0A4Y9AAZ2_9BACI|nr:solute:sodium symporter family transporter [Lentibacillus salicampi]TFJ92090.1 solute:sodium symporter family transporter [Lentibacillus salicampi]